MSTADSNVPSGGVKWDADAFLASARDRCLDNNPFPGIDKRGPDLPRSCQQLCERRARYLRLYPNRMRYLKLQAHVDGGKRFEVSHAWPDWVEDWEDEYRATLDEATNEDTSAKDVCEHLYEHNEEFRQAIDEDEKEEAKLVREKNHERNMAVWHRIGWTIVWLRRMQR